MARPRIRLLFDELMPPRVAAALRELHYNVTHIGGDHEPGTPAKGSSDEIVLEHARRTNQVVVTSNHDMILLCEEQGESVVWVDPRGRNFTREELVVLCFRGAPQWEHWLADRNEGPVCIRVRRSKSDVVALSEAARIARQRMRRMQAKERRRKRSVAPERSPRLPEA